MDLIFSVVIPIYNEEENIIPLTEEILQVLTDYKFEIIFIDDGSTDNSLKILHKLKEDYRNSENATIVILELRRNSGQTAAMRAGFEFAKGKYVITMDGDRQNDPNDIINLYNSIQSEKADVICGWRKNRKDPLSKKIPSKISNFLHRKLTGLKINDSGCTLRIYVNDAIKDLPIHGEDHRFLPAIIYSRGYKVSQQVVNHRERKAGKSKYGFSRLWRGYLDLISTAFVYKTAVKPFQFYSKIALIPGLLGSAILIYLTYIKLVLDESIGDRPLLLLGILLEIFSLQFFLTGLTSEYISTANANNQPKYSVREISSSREI